MSQYSVKQVKHAVNCEVEVPGSKSITNRALLMAALSEGECMLNGVLFSDDSRHFLSCLIELGYIVEVNEVEKSVLIHGNGGKLPLQQGTINVGSAGTAARFLTAMLGLSQGEYTIEASEQMKKRPMRPLFEALISLGAEFTFLEKEGHLPVRVRGAYAQGIDADNHQPREVSIDISDSTQFLSALMMTAPMIKEGLKIHITSEKTEGSYIKITSAMMHQFGCNVKHTGSLYEIGAKQAYTAGAYQIEPDVSAACYFFAVAALTGGQVTVKNVHATSMQGDMKFLNVLEKMGCDIEDTSEGIRVVGPENGVYKGVDVDMNDFSDQALTLAALAVFAKTPTCIRNIGHIRKQECDRLHAIVTELTRIGLTVIEEESTVCILPAENEEIKPALIDTYEDHRVAMAFALIGLKVPGITIDNYECCKKTFENYFQVLETLL